LRNEAAEGRLFAQAVSLLLERVGKELWLGVRSRPASCRERPAIAGASRDWPLARREHRHFLLCAMRFCRWRIRDYTSAAHVHHAGRKMDLQAFRDSIAKSRPTAGLSPALQALWWDAKGDWDKAHERAQLRDDMACMRVHAYLHRKEGDQSNAEYWYRRCDATPSTLPLEGEWQELAQELLRQS
jgi:hypothetical protein